MAITFLALILIPANSAKAEITYGPVKSGQTLWQIAEGIRPDDTFTIEQFAYAIYDLNPDAFQSGNMNLLDKDVFLKIPDSDAIIKTTRTEAKKQLLNHVHALDVLRVDAKQLRTAKANTRVYKKQIKKVQKKLGKYRHKSRDWNITYRKLVTSKRNYRKSKKKVAKLRSLLLEKATLKYARPAKPASPIANADMSEVNQRLTSIQSSLKNLNQSNDTLVEKVQELATLNQRVKVLEEELGKNDELVIQLKNTLEMAQAAIEKQQLESKDFNQRLDELKANSENSATPPEEVGDGSADITAEEADEVQANQEEAPQQETVTEIPADTGNMENEPDVADVSPKHELQDEGENFVEAIENKSPEENSEVITPDVSIETETTQKEIVVEEQEAITDVNTDMENSTNQTDVVETSIPQDEAQSFKGTPIASTQNIMPEIENISDIIREVVFTSDQDISEEQLESISENSEHEMLDNNPVKVATISETPVHNHRHSKMAEVDTNQTEMEKIITNNMAVSATAMRTALVIENTELVETKKMKVMNHQRDFRQHTLTDISSDYQMKPLRKKIILIGGILNGFILLFVLFRLFVGRQTASNLEESDAKSYKSWQERHKPRQSHT